MQSPIVPVVEQDADDADAEGAESSSLLASPGGSSYMYDLQKARRGTYDV